MTTQTVTIITEMIDNLSGKTKKINEQINTMSSGVQRSSKQVEEFNKGILTTSRSLTKTTRGLKHFQFEWLSVMFIGMAINRVFSQYTKGALEWLGVTDLFTESMKLAVFTALEPFHNTLINLSGTLFDVSPQMQALVGWVVLLGQGFGGTLSFLGQFFLGFQGIKILLAGMGKVPFLGAILVGIKAIGAAIAGLALGTILLIIAIIVIAIIGMVMAWRENFLGMKEIVSVFVESVKSVFGGLFKVLEGLVKFFVAFFTGDFEGAKNAVIMIFKGLVQIVTGLIMALVTAIAGIVVGIARAVWGVIQTVWGFFKWLYQQLVGGSLIPDLVNAMILWFWKLPVELLKALVSALSGVLQWGKDFVKNIADGIASMAGKFKEAFLSILPSWARNSIWSSGSAVLEIITNIVEKVRRVVSGRQHGGSVFGGNPYLVGEAGPELFVPSSSGNIVPNNKLGGIGGSIVFSPIYNINVADKAEFERLIKNNNQRQVDDLRRLIQD